MPLVLPMVSLIKQLDEKNDLYCRFHKIIMVKAEHIMNG